MKLLEHFLGVLCAFCLMIIFLITSVEAVAYWTPGYYEHEYSKYNVTEAVRMEMDDDAWTCVRNTPGVTGFLGANGKPAPLSRDEYNKMMRKSAKGGTPKRTSVSIEVGTPVKVVSGPLADFDGKVSEVNAEAAKVKVTLLIFGRETPVELSFDQITVIE